MYTNQHNPNCSVTLEMAPTRDTRTGLTTYNVVAIRRETVAQFHTADQARKYIARKTAPLITSILNRWF